MKTVLLSVASLTLISTACSPSKPADEAQVPVHNGPPPIQVTENPAPTGDEGIQDEGKPQTQQKAEEQKPEEQKPEDQKPEDQKPEEQKPEEQKPEDQVQPPPQKAEEQKPEPEEIKPEEKKVEDKKAEEQKAEEQKPEPPPVQVEQKPPQFPPPPPPAPAPKPRLPVIQLQEQRLYIAKLDHTKLLRMLMLSKPAPEDKLRPLLKGSEDQITSMLLTYLTEPDSGKLVHEASMISDEVYREPEMERTKTLALRSSLAQVGDENLMTGDVVKRVLYLQTVLDGRILQDSFVRTAADVSMLIGTSAVLGWAAGLPRAGRYLGFSTEAAPRYSVPRAAAVGFGSLLLDSMAYAAGHNRGATGPEYEGLYLESLIPGAELKEILRE